MTRPDWQFPVSRLQARAFNDFTIPDIVSYSCGEKSKPPCRDAELSVTTLTNHRSSSSPQQATTLLLTLREHLVGVLLLFLLRSLHWSRQKQSLSSYKTNPFPFSCFPTLIFSSASCHHSEPDLIELGGCQLALNPIEVLFL